MTRKLYWEDAGLSRFTARVMSIARGEGGSEVVLDRTAFYPTGGGQPSDLGRLAGVPLLEATIEDDGRILHRLGGEASFKVGEEIEGEIDRAHRREMIQQHTGQHILSQAFFQLSGAETRGFRITPRGAEIDLTLEASAEEIPAAIARAEDLANEVVFDDREVRLHLLTPEEAAQMPLRKESFVSDCVRVVEIDGFDFSPCGGTHARRTGEVGLIAVRGWERAKRMTRVEFVCGSRARRDYRAAAATADAIARRFSVGREEADQAVARLVERHRALERHARELAALAAQTEAQELLEPISPAPGARVIARIFEGRDLEELKLLAHRLIAHPEVIALLATREDEAARLVFARSPDLTVDLSAVLRAVCERMGGRGGGRPDFAQGGGPRAAQLDEALALAREMVDAKR
jgi:alanyl-tRNA synthetase